MNDKFSEEITAAARLILSARYVTVLSGAGISVDSGIPPFRGPGGLWTKHGEPPMDGYQRFLANPKGHWEERLKRKGYAQELYATLGSAEPNPGHYALAELEKLNILQCLITQNIDDLHRRAGSQKLTEIHGNFTLLRCIGCGTRFSPKKIPLEVLPPSCPNCGGIIKTDVVIFGEPIPSDVLAVCQEETEKCDCMIAVGTSATVYPAAAFPQIVRQRGGSLIEANLYESELTPLCDVSLRGSTAETLPKLVECIKGEVREK